MLDIEKTFNPNSHIIQLKSQQGPKDYLPVQWRLVWFRDLCPEGQIETEMLHLDFNQEVEIEVEKWNDSIRKYEKVKKIAKGVAVFKATVKDGKGGVATGTKSENAASFGDWIEKAETGALAGLGYGTQFTGDELDEGKRIVDSGVEGQGQPPQQQQQHKQPAKEVDPDAPASLQQLSTVKKLQKLLGMEETNLEGLPFNDVAQLIAELSKRLNEQKKKAQVS